MTSISMFSHKFKLHFTSRSSCFYRSLHLNHNSHQDCCILGNCHFHIQGTKVLFTKLHSTTVDRRCGLVVRVPGYRARCSGFNFQRHHILWEGVDLEQGPLSLVSTSEELLGRNNSGSSLENREYGHGDLLGWPCYTLYPQKVALSSTSSNCSAGTVCSQTKATEFVTFHHIPHFYISLLYVNYAAFHLDHTSHPSPFYSSSYLLPVS
jgi:hypothetical protein